MQKIGKQNTAPVSVGDIGPSGDVILQQTMEDILKVANEKTPAEVSYCIITSIAYEGVFNPITPVLQSCKQGHNP